MSRSKSGSDAGFNWLLQSHRHSASGLLGAKLKICPEKPIFAPSITLLPTYAHFCTLKPPFRKVEDLHTETPDWRERPNSASKTAAPGTSKSKSVG